jgi:hypothetical protein
VNSCGCEWSVEAWHVFSDTEFAFFAAAYVGASAVCGGELDTLLDLVIRIGATCFVHLFGLGEFGREEVVLRVLPSWKSVSRCFMVSAAGTSVGTLEMGAVGEKEG